MERSKPTEATSSLEQLLLLELEQEQTEDSAFLESLPSVDLSTLLSEMAALKSEVRAETVASREQREHLQKALQLMEESLQQAQQREASLQSQLKQLQNKLTQQVGDAWLDGLERVERSYEKANLLAQPKRRWWRTVTDPSALSLAEGLALTKQHLQDKLRALGIQRIATVGQPFDPQKMEALETVSDPSLEDGIVVEELIPGYIDKQGVKRIAQVIVNQNKGK